MLHVGVSCAVVSVACSLVVTCWERADLLAVMFVVFCHFPKYVWARLAVKFFCRSFVLFVSCVSHTFASVHCCLVVTCWEKADLLALVNDIYCIFVTFSCGILAQVWYLIVSFLIFVIFLTDYT